MCVNGKEGQLYVPLVLIPGLPEKKFDKLTKTDSTVHMQLFIFHMIFRLCSFKGTVLRNNSAFFGHVWKKG